MSIQSSIFPRLRYLGAVVVVAALAAAVAEAEPTLTGQSAECEVVLAAAPTASRQLAMGRDGRTLVRENAESLLKQLADLPFGLTDAEMQDLRTQAPGHEFAPYTPVCLYPAIPRFALDGDARSAFTRPLFTTDGRTAVVAWSLAERDRGQGWICVVRNANNAWSATCIQTAVWAR